MWKCLASTTEKVPNAPTFRLPVAIAPQIVLDPRRISIDCKWNRVTVSFQIGWLAAMGAKRIHLHQKVVRSVFFGRPVVVIVCRSVAIIIMSVNTERHCDKKITSIAFDWHTPIQQSESSSISVHIQLRWQPEPNSSPCNENAHEQLNMNAIQLLGKLLYVRVGSYYILLIPDSL